MNNFFSSTAEYFMNTNDRWSKCVVVTGVGGARTDFVAGWLSTVLPTFFISNDSWKLYPVTGRSYIGSEYFLWANFLFHDAEKIQRDQCIEWLLETYSPNSNNFLIQKTHYLCEYIKNRLPPDLFDKLLIVNIVSDDNLETAVNLGWEFIVKTFFPKNIHNLKIWESQQSNTTDNTGIEDNLSDQQYVELLFSSVISRITAPGWLVRESCNNYPNVINVPYLELLTPKGKELLANSFNVELNMAQKHSWDSSLAVARSPDIIDAFGRSWSKTDFENEILLRYPNITKL